MSFYEYIKPELLVLIPVMYLIGMAVKKSRIKDKYIPLIIGLASVLLCILWVLRIRIYPAQNRFTRRCLPR